ncbi:hypothetical protein Sfum_3403 [Syntrophobacter fumaroxidans MPOB]|uniref:Uncharacterized protein n=1 Tax=Syntrophobacter fumaroxidans (strain DSM 10017 / MPOB) TaxID=335543 RepID=A0LNS4_SYNFM|nr:hypothetical protein Sfum_3403 [Syntrophobacter fumaroxidans MPOB]
MPMPVWIAPNTLRQMVRGSPIVALSDGFHRFTPPVKPDSGLREKTGPARRLRIQFRNGPSGCPRAAATTLGPVAKRFSGVPAKRKAARVNLHRLVQSDKSAKLHVMPSMHRKYQ